MAEVLEAWLEDEYVGTFSRVYGVISVSLPRDGGWGRSAPARFLDNLLPENRVTRDFMRSSLNAASDEPFSSDRYLSFEYGSWFDGK